ncbi:MAG: alpha/beta hydrolase [Acidobacteria bacterium]|nr:alpha/beta hydrolase [Acidobacteriota bacterium]
MSQPLARRVDGSGDPVLLLNGGMMTISNWNNATKSLQTRWRVVRCDFRGQLLSPGPPLHTDLSGHVVDVVALLNALDVARAHIIGTSFGAEVGLLLAASHPDRVASLVAATATDWSTPEMMAGSRALVEACHEATRGGNRFAFYDLLLPSTYSPAFLDANAAWLAARREHVAALPDSWFDGTASIVGAMVGLDLRPRLRDIVCPTLVIIAEHDGVMPLDRSRAIVAGIAGAEEAFVSGSGHALVVEQLEVFLRLCEGFLAGLPNL